MLKGKVIVKTLRMAPLHISSHTTQFRILKTWKNPMNGHQLSMIECNFSNISSGFTHYINTYQKVGGEDSIWIEIWDVNTETLGLTISLLTMTVRRVGGERTQSLEASNDYLVFQGWGSIIFYNWNIQEQFQTKPHGIVSFLGIF